MQRKSYYHDGLTLSYLDSGGSERALVGPHAHMMTASTFESLAAALVPEWRVIALDQRGHGHSDHAANYTRNDYVGDIEAQYSAADASRWPCDAR